jgi:hypothetical protein
MGDNISNTTNNFSYNIKNEVTYMVIPSTYSLKSDLETLDSSAKEHLGFIYEPTELLIYTINCFANLTDSSEIAIDIPEITFKDVALVPSMKFSFTDFMDQAPKFGEIHKIYLMVVDFVIYGLLINYAIKVSKEVFRK